jgi:hypothetical protein
MKHILITLSLLFFFIWEGKSLTLTPQSQISLITCGAGTEIYSYFGHSAIRVKDPENHLDIVFNYGAFSFDTPHFVWRFCLGQTDYALVIQGINDFMNEYYVERRDVFEQALNFTQDEKQKLFDALIINAEPQNRIYRYNHFLDNCATRIRDQFEKVLDGKLIYNTSIDKPMTYRQMLDECLPDNSWSGFGIKLALGVPCDRNVDFRGKMFLPFYLQKDMDNAKVKKDDQTIPFCQPLQTLYKAPPERKEFDPASPVMVVICFFMITLILTIREYQLKKRFIWLDSLVYLIFGTAGMILGFLCFISQLEATGWNLNLLWAWPTHFIFAFLVWIPALREKFSWYPRITTYTLIIFLLIMYFLPQTFHWLVIPLSLTLLLRTADLDKLRKIGKKDLITHQLVRKA